VWEISGKGGDGGVCDLAAHLMDCIVHEMLQLVDDKGAIQLIEEGKS